MDLGIAPIDHLAVHPDLAVAVVHGSGNRGHAQSPFSTIKQGAGKHPHSRVCRLESPF
jgi:hypothetical protein